MKSIKVTNYPTRVDFSITKKKKSRMNIDPGSTYNAWTILGELDHTGKYMNPEAGEKSAAQHLEKLWEKFNAGHSIYLNWIDGNGNHRETNINQEYWELKQIKVGKPYEHNYEYIALDFGPL
jgi:hypothetical protein